MRGIDRILSVLAGEGSAPFLRPLCGDPVTLVVDDLAVVSHLVPLIGDAVALVSQAVALVSQAVALVGGALALLALDNHRASLPQWGRGGNAGQGVNESVHA